mmetsp:Transcript_38/g.108  ORF Transcript_38/g.108 Transcript_38/m.108 type:complete len:219 (-) Transcript_38:53-709(-)
MKAWFTALICIGSCHARIYNVEDAPEITGWPVQLPLAGDVDQLITDVASKGPGAFLVDWNLTRFHNTSKLIHFVRDFTQKYDDPIYDSFDQIQTCGIDPKCLSTWRTHPALHGKNLTITKVVKVVSQKEALARCHVKATLKFGFCHEKSFYDKGWGYFAMAKANNETKELPLAVMCHYYDETMIPVMNKDFGGPNAIEEALARPPACHYMLGNSFIAM